MLHQRIAKKNAKICILGLGHVGLPLIFAFAQQGFNVFGYDTDSEKIEALNRKELPLAHLSSTDIHWNRCHFSSNPEVLCQADIYIIAVPTPLQIDGLPDTSLVRDAVSKIMNYLKHQQLVVLESTVSPGMTEELLIEPISSLTHLRIGRDIFIAHTPERVDPGNQNFTLLNTPRLCSGHTPLCLDYLCQLYKTISPNIHRVDSIKVAEMSKMVENSFRAVNIAFINEMKELANALDIDIYDVVKATATKPYGFMSFTPGPGVGGHCIAVDPYYLIQSASQLGVSLPLTQSATNLNKAHPENIAKKILGEIHSKNPRKKVRILQLGVAYKKNIGDIRESPAMSIFNILVKSGVEIFYSDPHVPIISHSGIDYYSQIICSDLLTTMDAIVITTDHNNFDYQLIYKYSPLIFDSRGVYPQEIEKVIRI